jgi:hypothetical protein
VGAYGVLMFGFLGKKGKVLGWRDFLLLRRRRLFVDIFVSCLFVDFANYLFFTLYDCGS